jgi:2-succinyl-5-enolpyruvyl-6-hydroxy-3-cyclohexene-1-carboxylate synthase
MIAAHKNIRMLLYLLKAYNIRYFVMSPGARNIPLVKSIEDDPFFTCYSVVDERSAAYFAVGLTLEVKAPVAITCTSAQATRNYIPGMTEAFYRRAPVLAITSDYDENFTNQQNMQSVRQMSIPSDTANVSVDIPIIKDRNDEHLATRRINQALDALTRYGGGPAHVNLRIDQHWVRGKDELEPVRKITRYLPLDTDWPSIGNRKVLLVVGQHHPFSNQEKREIEYFAQKHNVAIYVNHISNYNGKKSVHGNIILSKLSFNNFRPDLLITIGGHLGDYPLDGNLKKSKVEHWRVCEDGNYSDSYNSLTKVFECTESYFFRKMAEAAPEEFGSEYFEYWQNAITKTHIPEDLPLSHALVAKKLSPLIPPETNLHFGILNSLRNWDLFQLDSSIKCYSNVAGFGIDGSLSTFLGQSAASDLLNVLVIGDLSFFYDMNAIGIRHIRNNVRIILLNNGGGGEFRLYTSPADQFGDASNRHIAAAGHFGESAEGWVKNNGFEYLAVRTKDELDPALSVLVKPSERSIVLEVFTKMKDDSDAYKTIIDANNRLGKIVRGIKISMPNNLKYCIKKLIGR